MLECCVWWGEGTSGYRGFGEDTIKVNIGSWEDLYSVLWVLVEEDLNKGEEAANINLIMYMYIVKVR